MFFKFQDGQPLTKSKFTSHVKAALVAVGLPCDKFTGQSYCIGAATSATRVGIEDSKFYQLGCWNSSACWCTVQLNLSLTFTRV